MTRPTRLIDDDLFTDGHKLAGGRCSACSTTTFPWQADCPRCGGDDLERVALPTRGHLWAFTVQGFPPKPPYRGPDPFVPYGVGYVNLGPVCVETPLTENDPSRLRIGDPFELVLVPAWVDGEETVQTFAFRPAEEDQ